MPSRPAEDFEIEDDLYYLEKRVDARKPKEGFDPKKWQGKLLKVIKDEKKWGVQYAMVMYINNDGKIVFRMRGGAHPVDMMFKNANEVADTLVELLFSVKAPEIKPYVHKRKIKGKTYEEVGIKFKGSLAKRFHAKFT
jgi:hypothetical protein